MLFWRVTFRHTLTNFQSPFDVVPDKICVGKRSVSGIDGLEEAELLTTNSVSFFSIGTVSSTKFSKSGFFAAESVLRIDDEALLLPDGCWDVKLFKNVESLSLIEKQIFTLATNKLVNCFLLDDWLDFFAGVAIFVGPRGCCGKKFVALGAAGLLSNEAKNGRRRWKQHCWFF